MIKYTYTERREESATSCGNASNHFKPLLSLPKKYWLASKIHFWLGSAMSYLAKALKILPDYFALKLFMFKIKGIVLQLQKIPNFIVRLIKV